MKITEGYMPYLEYKTYYRVVGESRDGKKPLVLLHGGPGSTHNYFEVMDCLAEEGRQIVMYDQLGCGLSSTPSRPDLWNAGTWVEELIALRKHLNLEGIHLLGQSWGGMQAIIYTCDYNPKGIASLILSSTLPSAKLWEKEQHRMIGFLPKEMQEAIAAAVESGNYETPEYRKANEEYMERHCAGAPKDTDPECVRRPKKAGQESYVVGWGPNEYTPTGTLKDYEYMDKLPGITCPTLITSGVNDLCTPYVAKIMYDLIPNSQWALFRHSRHMAFVEEHEKYMKILSKWLREND